MSFSTHPLRSCEVNSLHRNERLGIAQLGSRSLRAKGSAATQSAIITQNPYAPKWVYSWPETNISTAVGAPMPTAPQTVNAVASRWPGTHCARSRMQVRCSSANVSPCRTVGHRASSAISGGQQNRHEASGKCCRCEQSGIEPNRRSDPGPRNGLTGEHRSANEGRRPGSAQPPIMEMALGRMDREPRCRARTYRSAALGAPMRPNEARRQRTTTIFRSPAGTQVR